MKYSDGASPASRPSSDSQTLSVFRAVLTEFHRREISYCYWKSGRRIHSVLRGDGDLDLLVGRADQHRAEMILLHQGLKLFPTAANRDHPSILSFLGFDEASGRLVHVHVHLRLIVGERLLRNYRLPWEEAVLARTFLHPVLQIRMLEPTTEAVLLAVRSCLELSYSDPVVLRQWREAHRKFDLDRADVAARVDCAALHDLAATLLHEQLAPLLVNAVCSNVELDDQARFRRGITRYLAPYRTYNAYEARLRGLWRTLLWIAGNANRRALHLPRPWSRRAPGGGCVIAIVGVDGSGKTTVGAAIRSWLSAEVDSVPIYFGTGAGRPSLLLRPFKLIVPLVTRLLRSKPKGASHGNVSDQPPGALYTVLMTIWATTVAREKRNKLLAARRGANRGLVVITDRYPQNEIDGFNDGPLLTRLTNVPGWLRRLEEKAYALSSRLRPDLVIKLDVLAATAAGREPDMAPSLIRDRIAELRRVTFAGAPTLHVNAEQPLNDVIRAVKSAIWRVL